jgi:hypothetical protein
MTLLDVDEHRELFTSGGYSDVQVIVEREKGWISVIGRKPEPGVAVNTNRFLSLPEF